MTYAEWLADAQLKAQALYAAVSLTDQSFMLMASEALTLLQQGSRVVKTTLTIASSSLDANGQVALNRGVTLPVRVTFTPTGGSSPFPCIGQGPDAFADIKMRNFPGYTLTPGFYPGTGGSAIYFAVEQNKLSFYPFKSLTGTFTLTCHTKIGVYNSSQATDATSFWYGWTGADCLTKMGATQIPQEFDAAEIELIQYVAAQMLSYIPNWKKRFRDNYDEWMLPFNPKYENNVFQKVLDNAPRYPENYEPHISYGPIP